MAVAAAWIPVRADLPGTDVALILVVGVGLVGLAAGRWVAAVGAIAAGVAFDLFDTPPYGTLAMTRGRDIATAVLLVGAGILVGWVSARLRSYRTIAARRADDFAVMSGAARLMAVGEDAPVVVGALAGELLELLDLADCEFVAGPPSGARPWVTPDGTVAPGATGRPLDPADPAELDLPIWEGDRPVGRYRMVLASPAWPSPERLRAAAGLADQAAAALASYRPGPAPDPTDPGPGPVRRLRIVR